MTDRSETPPGTARSAAGCDHLLRDPLFLENGALCVGLGGKTIPLLMGSNTIAHVGVGWRAESLFTGFAPLLLLELVHESGARATWFFDDRMTFAGDAVQTLPQGLLDLLKLHAAPLLRRLATQLLERCAPELDPRVAAFLCLNEAMRTAIAVACLDMLVRPPALQTTELMTPHGAIYRAEDDTIRSLDRGHLMTGLGQDWQARIPEFVRAGRMSWPSPVDGAPLHAQGGLAFDDFHFAFRFADARHGLVFFVVVGEHLSAVAGLWFPSMGLMISHDQAQAGLASILAPSLPFWTVSHLAMFADLLIPYLARGAKRFASVMRGPPSVHLGHQLWNELSGIDRILQEGGDALPEWIVLNNGRGIELYGQIDVLFDELRGRVNRTLADTAALIRHAYAEQLFVLRVTGQSVSAGLRERIQAHAARSATVRQALAALPSQRAAPVIVFGLRVENRTIVDLPGFLDRFVTFVAGRYPGSVIVFDGHNASTEVADDVIGSHGERFALRRPVDVERELVAQVRARSASLPVTILDTIGMPIATSIAWATASDGFVSIWGASLAKYRWVCNKPGYVLSGRANLSSRSDLHIYDDPRYMQDPTPLLFADPDAVSDRPEAVSLIPFSPGDWGLYNFEIDADRVLSQIGTFMDGLAAARPRSAWTKR